jgi:hypothetical protein
MHLDLDRIPDFPEFEEPTFRDFQEAEGDTSSLNNEILEAAKSKRYIQNTKLRMYLAVWAAILVSSWMFKVGEIVVNNNDRYCLSENVLITLLTTTTIEVLGVIAIVMKDLFNTKSEDKIK